MYVSALQMGLTVADIAREPFGRIANLLGEWADMQGGGGTRDATQEDIEQFLY